MTTSTLNTLMISGSGPWQLREPAKINFSSEPVVSHTLSFPETKEGRAIARSLIERALASFSEALTIARVSDKAVMEMWHGHVYLGVSSTYVNEPNYATRATDRIRQRLLDLSQSVLA